MAFNGRSSPRAWVNFNGENNSIRDDEEVSSITDHGTGKYTINLSFTFPNNNYVWSGSGGRSNNDSNQVQGEFVQNRTQSSTKIRFADVQGNDRDCGIGCVIFYGDY
tara:strand:+ start:42 stop:362 length:321 start_codon:yes stop_codon:yes gene_type:complete